MLGVVLVPLAGSVPWHFLSILLHHSGTELLSGKTNCVACYIVSRTDHPCIFQLDRSKTAKEMYAVYITVGSVLCLISKPMH